MERYIIVVQENGGAGPDHWVASNAAGPADKFAKWVHKATGAAVNIFDTRQERSRLTLGNFDESRT
jgi:hypothetical protein